MIFKLWILHIYVSLQEGIYLIPSLSPNIKYI